MLYRFQKFILFKKKLCKIMVEKLLVYLAMQHPFQFASCVVILWSAQHKGCDWYLIIIQYFKARHPHQPKGLAPATNSGLGNRTNLKARHPQQPQGLAPPPTSGLGTRNNLKARHSHQTQGPASVPTSGRLGIRTNVRAWRPQQPFKFSSITNKSRSQQ